MAPDYDQAIARLPRWILLLAFVGTALALAISGANIAVGFLVGSLGAYLNLRLLERVTARIVQPGDHAKAGHATGIWLFIQFSALVLGVLVILNFSHFNRLAAVCGFLVFPAAVMLEMLYELVTLKH